MDIVTGLSAITQALGIAKELRAIERGVDEADYKLKLADLSTNLAEVKIALSDANLKLNEQEIEVKRLTKALDEAKNGPVCPKCRLGRLNLVSVNKMLMGGLGRYGVEERKYSCDGSSCDFESTVVHDPQGLVVKHIGKR